MPIRVNLKEIFPSDPQEINVDKVNFNFNKLLELGVGSPGPIGLTGPVGPAGPVGSIGPQGDRGATWWVDSGNPNTLTFTGLIDGDLYLDQTSTAFEVYQYDDATSTWNSVVSIAAIVNAYLATAAPSPFTIGPTGTSTTSTKFVVFDTAGLTPGDYTSDGTRGQFNTSRNKTLFLTNFDENIIVPTTTLLWPTIQDSLYTSIFKVFANHSDAPLSTFADLGRYHLELGSLYNNGTNTLLSDIKHNLKGKFFKRYIGLGAGELPLTNEWINTAKFSLSTPEPFIYTQIDQNGEFEFSVPKYNAESALVQDELSVRIGSYESQVEHNATFTHIVADGITFALTQAQITANIGLANNYVSAYTRLNNKELFMLDTNPTMHGILLNDKTYVIGNANIIGKVSIGDIDPTSTLTVGGNASIGTGYQAIAAPTGGAIIEGNTGVGTSSPTAKVHINNNTSSDSFRVDDAGSPDTSPFIITQTGDVGIGTDSPSTKLHVVGEFRLQDGTETASSYLSGDANGNTSFSPISTIGVPVGAIMPYFGSAPPAGWLLCDGQFVGFTYPALRAHLIANGSSIFLPFPLPGVTLGLTPDLRNRFIVGAGSTYSLQDTGGSDTVALDKSEIPKHTHLMDGDTSTVNIASSGGHSHSHSQGGANSPAQNVDIWSAGDSNNYTRSITGGAHTHATSNFDGHTGDGTTDGLSGVAHENRPPYYALTYIIKT